MIKQTKKLKRSRFSNPRSLLDQDLFDACCNCCKASKEELGTLKEPAFQEDFSNFFNNTFIKQKSYEPLSSPEDCFHKILKSSLTSLL